MPAFLKQFPILLVMTGLFMLGCSDSKTYETRKPATEDPASEIEENAEEIAAEVDETLEDAADAVTPDREIVDIDTPLGDVDVSEDRATGDTKVDVDTE